MMPQPIERETPVPPRLVVSRPPDELASSSARSSPERRRRGVRIVKEQAKSSSPEWIDVDDSPPRRRKSRRRSSQSHERGTRSSKNTRISEHDAENDLPRFFPSLAKILEVNESITSSRQSTKGSDHKRHREGSSSRRSRNRDDQSTTYRRPAKHRTGGVSRRNESLLKLNPSLLSVLSSLTGNSDRSSGSSSTVTQQSYDRQASNFPRGTSGESGRPGTELRSIMTSRPQATPPNVFDFMQSPTGDDGADRQSVISISSGSRYEHSDAGSSVAPDTPSSQSTFPSPTTTISQSVADLRKRCDAPYASSERSNSNSPYPSSRGLRKQPSVSDVPEDDEESLNVLGAQSSEISYGGQRRSSSRSSIGSRRSSDRLHRQEESLRQHMEHTQQGHYIQPIYGQHRSYSNSSEHSDQSAYAHHMAMQQYQWPPPPVPMAPPVPPQAINGHIAPPESPLPYDPSRRTLTGYEELALELSNSESAVKPLYRKFEYLNHRILLHLQDELCELEEQLRMLDEIIGQMDPALADGQKTPASRRGETFHGSEIHLRRTHLLGHIFMKTEQYNRAMTAYASMAKDSAPADDDQLASYRDWMAKHAPVHDVETRFLRRKDDLVMPGRSPPSVERPTKHAALAYLPLALMLPLLLFSIIPTLAGRPVVTALIAMGAFVVAATTRIRHLMPTREWALCGAIYVLLMAAVSACIPSHAS